MDKLKTLGDDLFEDPIEEDLLTDSEAEEATRSLQRLLDDNSARPIPIPSHKRSPVVKYQEEGMQYVLLFYKCWKTLHSTLKSGENVSIYFFPLHTQKNKFPSLSILQKMLSPPLHTQKKKNFLLNTPCILVGSGPFGPHWE